MYCYARFDSHDLFFSYLWFGHSEYEHNQIELSLSRLQVAAADTFTLPSTGAARGDAHNLRCGNLANAVTPVRLP